MLLSLKVDEDMRERATGRRSSVSGSVTSSARKSVSSAGSKAERVCLLVSLAFMSQHFSGS